MSAAFVRPDAPLTVVLLTYVAPIEEVDAQLEAHVAWLKAGLEAGVILVAGRRTPRSGGVILFRGTAEAVEPVVQADPFVTSGVATYDLIPFNASLAATTLGDALA